MIAADGKFLAEKEGEVYFIFLWTVARDSHRGPLLNSLHFIAQTKIGDVSLSRQTENKSDRELCLNVSWHHPS